MNESSKFLDIFNENLEAVNRLANFDRIVLDYSIKSIETLQNKLKKNFENESLLATGTLNHLKIIREHDSMRHQYEEIFNQCVVLLVSYFGSSISDIFKYYVNKSFSLLKDEKAFSEEFKFSPKELVEYSYNLVDNIGDIIITKKNISFQDMQSVSRNFKDFLIIEIKKEKYVNDIIIGQACRHVIVHSGAKVDKKMKTQILNTQPRNLLPNIIDNTKIQFTTQDLDILSKSMTDYIENLLQLLKKKYG